MKQFGLMGAAGYIAPRHMAAIKEIGGVLSVATDLSDSVGILDRYAPESYFFTDQQLFLKHLDRNRIDYLTICTPNNQHFQHIQYALNRGITPICEKPVVLTMDKLEQLAKIEAEGDLKINTIMQLRLHPVFKQLKQQLNTPKRHTIELTYIAPRGRWYHQSWKGDQKRSGGLATNIGIHFFDMLIALFGPVERSILHFSTQETMGGMLYLKRGDVRWMLSIDRHLKQLREIVVDEKKIDFTTGFDQLHTESYRRILDGGGFGLNDAAPAIDLVESLRDQCGIGLVGDYHPVLRGVV